MPPPLKGPDGSTPVHSLRDVLAHNVRAYRVRQGVSQEKLGFATELDRTFISQVERSRINVSIDNIEKLARGLEVDPSSLLVRPDKAEEEMRHATLGKDAS